MAIPTSTDPKSEGPVQHALEWFSHARSRGYRTELEIRQDSEFARELEEDALEAGAPVPQTRMEPFEGELLFQLYVPGATPDRVDVVWHAERETLVVAVEDEDESSDSEWLWYAATWLPQIEIAGAKAWFEADLVRVLLPVKTEYRVIEAEDHHGLS